MTFANSPPVYIYFFRYDQTLYL